MQAKSEEPRRLPKPNVNREKRATKSNGRVRRQTVNSNGLSGTGRKDLHHPDYKPLLHLHATSQIVAQPKQSVARDKFITNLDGESVNTPVHQLADGFLLSKLSDPTDTQQGIPGPLVPAANDGLTKDHRRNNIIAKVASSADAFVSAREAALKAARGSERLEAARRKYYRKAIALMSVGGVIFATGVTMAILFFCDKSLRVMRMAGPICLAVGLLLVVCGMVWIPIIKAKLKRQQQVMSRTFSL
ncbi:unnamed protein product [Clavelina lepadiformis]|uniref:Uncharacterized protein n=1 Tax=Clavelina lepadiformis TaxID=159417 RepID=A0ABP0FUD1_CLALP